VRDAVPRGDAGPWQADPVPQAADALLRLVRVCFPELLAKWSSAVAKPHRNRRCVVKRLCVHCGFETTALRVDWCPDCGRLLNTITDRRRRLSIALELLMLVGLALVFVLAALLLNGCGPAFTATTEEELSTAGAGGHPQTLPQAGAGGREVSSAGTTATGTAGSAHSGAGGSAGAEASAGAPPTGLGGAGGASDSAGGDAALGGSGASAASCLTAWRGSSCDTCTSLGTSAGRTCAEVLDCYQASACTVASCTNPCNFNAPTSDAAVQAAERVLACRCGGAP